VTDALRTGVHELEDENYRELEMMIRDCKENLQGMEG